MMKWIVCLSVGLFMRYECNGIKVNDAAVDVLEGSSMVADCGLGQTACGGNCCRFGEQCLDGVCCRSRNDMCGNTCCGLMQRCVDRGAGLCCGTGQEGCGGQCCGFGQRCANAASGLCCGAGASACGSSTCCGVTQTCAVADIGLCCGRNEFACGSQCCGNGNSCVNGKCCPRSQACGNVCCGSDQLCANAQNSECVENSCENVFKYVIQKDCVNQPAMTCGPPTEEDNAPVAVQVQCGTNQNDLNFFKGVLPFARLCRSGSFRCFEVTDESIERAANGIPCFNASTQLAVTMTNFQQMIFQNAQTRRTSQFQNSGRNVGTKFLREDFVELLRNRTIRHVNSTCELRAAQTNSNTRGSPNDTTTLEPALVMFFTTLFAIL